MKLRLKEYENPYWSDSSVLRVAGNLAIAINGAIADADNTKDQTYILSKVIGEVKELCDDYRIDYDNLLNYHQEIEDWVNKPAEIEDEEDEIIEDSEEATQPEDIAKKEEYKKMVTPEFKVGKKIKESETAADNLLDKIAKELQEEPLIKKYMLDHTWTSGSSTTVYPIMRWKESVDVQLNTDRNVFKNLLKRYEDKYNIYAYFVKNDGSCPPELRFRLKYGVDYEEEI